MQLDAAPIVRERLRHRVEGAAPAILALIAPAGFGKTAFLRQLYGEDFATLRCDCSAIRDDLDLARRLLPGLVDELEDGGRSAADRLALALDAFAALRRPTVIFDNAEAIAHHPAAMQFFTHLLARRPATMQIVVASRVAFPVRFTRFVPPHELLVLRAPDFAFDAREVREAFEGLVEDEATLARVADLSIGWPIAVFLLRRIASEGRLADGLARIDHLAFDELHDYLCDEVVSSFDERVMRSLFVCASVPGATSKDVRDIHDDDLAPELLAQLARDWPFLTSDGETYTVHPFVASLLREHQHERRRALLSRLAAIREAEGDFERQAELLLAIGEDRAAAAALARFEGILNAPPSARYRAVLAQLDPAVVLRHARPWAIGALARMYSTDVSGLLDEAESVWRTLDQRTPLEDRYVVFALRILLLAYAGRGPEAVAETEAFSALLDPADPLSAHLSFLLAFAHARAGFVDRAAEEINRALPFAKSGEVIAAAAYLTLATDIARVRGDRMEEQFLALAAQRAQEAGLPNLFALTIAQRLFGAWLSGHTELVETRARELEPFVHGGVRGFAYVLAAALGREAEPAPDDLPEFVVYGHLIALQRAHDDARRRRLARAAYDLAVKLHMPFLQTLAALAVAHGDDAQLERYRALAEEAAQRVESAPLHAAVRAAFEPAGDAGMLSAYLAQVAHAYAYAPPIEVGMWSGRVAVEGRPVVLAGRELELLVAIASRPEAVSRARLAAQLWPDLDEASARNALGVCLHRLRARLKRDDAIERDGDGYRLHHYAAVTLWRLERVAPALRASGILGERERVTLERLWAELGEAPHLAMTQWEWFEPSMRRLREAWVDITHRLGADALARAKTSAALLYADAAAARDECDEKACEIAIRAHLACGDRAAAMRTFRRYRDALKVELSAEPSKSLVELFVQ